VFTYIEIINIYILLDIIIINWSILTVVWFTGMVLGWLTEKYVIVGVDLLIMLTFDCFYLVNVFIGWILQSFPLLPYNKGYSLSKFP